MTADQIRYVFEERHPLPDGVQWIGEHYSGTAGVVGSWSNATIWAHRYAGWAACAKEFGLDCQSIGHMTDEEITQAEDDKNIARTMRDHIASPARSVARITIKPQE